jgi:hypothetical protein
MSFFAHHHTLDVHLHDTYYVVAASYAYLSLSAIQFVFFILYKAVKRIIFSKTLTWIHTIVTITIPVGSLYFFSHAAVFRNAGEDIKRVNWETFEAAQNDLLFFTIIFAVFILAQLAFLRISVSGG